MGEIKKTLARVLTQNHEGVKTIIAESHTSIDEQKDGPLPCIEEATQIISDSDSYLSSDSEYDPP